jgi:O-antigen/teichoic acid export membrane protein
MSSTAAITEAPVKALSLRANFSWTLVGNALFAVCQWAMLAVLTRLVSPAEVGLYALAIAISVPVVLFTNLHLRGVQATDARREYPFGVYLGLRLAGLAAAGVAIAGVGLVAGYDQSTLLVLGWITVAKLFDSLSDLVYGLLQQHEQMDRIAISRMILGVLQVSTMGLVVYKTRSVVLGSAAFALASGIVTLGFDFRNACRVLRAEGAGQANAPTSFFAVLAPIWDRSRLVQLALLAAPLGIVAVIDSLNSSIPRYFIERTQGLSALGYFSAIVYLMMTGGVVMSALGNSLAPRLSRLYVTDIPAFRRLVLRGIAVALVMGVLPLVAALLWGAPLLTLLYRADYARHADVFGWIMGVALIWHVTTIMYFAVTAARQFKPQAPLMAIVAVVTVAASALLVPRFGLTGAAWALAAGMIIRFLGTAWILAVAMRTPREPAD